jgi:hypothetical protein
MISDPMVGIASPWMGRGHEFKAWHCSDDTAEQIDAETMYSSSFLAAVFGYFVAAAGDEDAAWLAEQMLPLMEAELGDRVKPDQTERQHFWRWALRKAIESTAKLADKSTSQLKIGAIAQRFEGPDELQIKPAEFEDAAAASLIPVRNVWGTITFESLPAEKRTQGSPRWNGQVTDAWYWADGKRSIAEIAQIVSLELGTPVRKSLPAFFALAAEAGLCKLKRA